MEIYEERFRRIPYSRRRNTDLVRTELMKKLHRQLIIFVFKYTNCRYLPVGRILVSVAVLVDLVWRRNKSVRDTLDDSNEISVTVDMPE